MKTGTDAVMFFYTFFSELSASFSDQIRLSHKHRGFFCPIRFLASKSAFWSFGDTICGPRGIQNSEFDGTFFYTFFSMMRDPFFILIAWICQVGLVFCPIRITELKLQFWSFGSSERKCQFHGSQHVYKGSTHTQVPIS